MSMRRLWGPAILGCVLLVLVILIAIAHGASEANLADLWLQSSDSLLSEVLWDVRIPRVLLAALSGGMLAVAGVLSQGLFRNALASPDILGTAAGGTVGATIVFYLGSAWLHWSMLPIAAFVGCLVASFGVVSIAGRRSQLNTESLLLAGFAVSATLGALTSFIVTLTLEDYQKSGALIHWLLGGFSGTTWDHMRLALIPLIPGLWLAWNIASKLDVLSLGESVAETLVGSVSRLRVLTLMAIACLVGGVVCVAGAIPFVGLMVPHVIRRWLGPTHRHLVILSFIYGAAFLTLVDLLARSIRQPLEIEVGMLTALLGGPFFLGLLLRKVKS